MDPSLQRHFKQRKVAEVPSKVRKTEGHGSGSSRLIPSEQRKSSSGDPKRNISDSLLRKVYINTHTLVSEYAEQVLILLFTIYDFF